jgi:phage major head subunit gpT-like protein
MKTIVRLGLEIDRAKQSDAERLEVPVCISSDTPLHQPELNRMLRLSHTDGAIVLDRAKVSGIPVREMHQRALPLARVFDPWIGPDSKLRGTMRFSRSGDGKARYQDVMDGIISDLSVGAELHDEDELLIATRWEPVEVSIVDTGLDPAAGIARIQREETKMPETDGQKTENGGRETVDVMRRDYKVAQLAGEKKARQEERQRISEIDEIFTLAIIPKSEWFTALRARAIDEGWNVDLTRKQVMESLNSEPAIDHRMMEVERKAPAAPGNQPRELGRVEMKADQMDKFHDVAIDTILVRAGLDDSKETVRRVAEGGFRSLSLQKLGEEFLALRNVSTRGLGNDAISKMLVTRSGPHTHSDFTSILANVATKAAQRGWTEANTTWQDWCNVGSLPDFKPATIAGLGAFPDLDKIPYGGGPYAHKSMDDVHETAQIETYGALFGISRRAIQDDDLMQLTRTPIKMGAAAARKVNSLAYAVVATTGQTMTEDSTALFDVSTHANYVASSGAVPSTTTLDVAYAAMMKQKAPLRSGDTSTPYLNIRPQFLLVPPELMGVAETVAQAQYDPNAGTTTKNQFNPNRYQGRLTVVTEALMSATSTTAWILAAPKNGPVDTVTVFFLDGRQEPYLEEATQIEYDGVTWKVRIDAVARALDWRGMYKNIGA